MSRTYRCRHLPVLPGTPRKLVASRLHVRQGWIFRDEVLPGYGDTTYAVGYLLAHPWLSYESSCPKRHLRIRGNRRVRRETRRKLRAWVFDPERCEDHLPEKLDGWDYWEVW
jgi:hypothetical protein